MNNIFLYGPLRNTSFLPHMKHSYEFPVRHDLKKNTLALIEPRIVSAVTREGIPQDEIWQTLIFARTVTQWCRKTKSALAQIGNPSNRTITLKSKTVVGTISPVTAISPRTASTITHNHSESQARIDLTAALDESLKNSTFNDQQKTQLLDPCTQYRSVFSLTQKELVRCTIVEAEFSLQKTKNQWIVIPIGRIQEHKK